MAHQTHTPCGTGQTVSAKTSHALWTRPAIVASALSLAASGASADGDKYLKFGAGIEMPAAAEFVDEDCRNDNFLWLYGCGKGKGGAPYRRSAGKFSRAPAFEFGVGMQAAPNVRLEAVLDYRPRHSFSGKANWNYSTDVQDASATASTITGMVAGYLDLPEHGFSDGRITPFLGAGIGASRTTVQDFQIKFPRTTTHAPDGSNTNLAWMLAAGFSREISDNTTVEFALRYTDLGKANTGIGAGSVTFNDGNTDPIHLRNLGKTEARLRSYGLRVALRFAF